MYKRESRLVAQTAGMKKRKSWMAYYTSPATSQGTIRRVADKLARRQERPWSPGEKNGRPPASTPKERYPQGKWGMEASAPEMSRLETQGPDAMHAPAEKAPTQGAARNPPKTDLAEMAPRGNKKIGKMKKGQAIGPGPSGETTDRAETAAPTSTPATIPTPAISTDGKEAAAIAEKSIKKKALSQDASESPVQPRPAAEPSNQMPEAKETLKKVNKDGKKDKKRKKIMRAEDEEKRNKESEELRMWRRGRKAKLRLSRLLAVEAPVVGSQDAKASVESLSMISKSGGASAVEGETPCPPTRLAKPSKLSMMSATPLAGLPEPEPASSTKRSRQPRKQSAAKETAADAKPCVKEAVSQGCSGVNTTDAPSKDDEKRTHAAPVPSRNPSKKSARKNKSHEVANPDSPGLMPTETAANMDTSHHPAALIESHGPIKKSRTLKSCDSAPADSSDPKPAQKSNLDDRSIALAAETTTETPELSPDALRVCEFINKLPWKQEYEDMLEAQIAIIFRKGQARDVTIEEVRAATEKANGLAVGWFRCNHTFRKKSRRFINRVAVRTSLLSLFLPPLLLGVLRLVSAAMTVANSLANRADWLSSISGMPSGMPRGTSRMTYRRCGSSNKS
jgi:hypothetical protein